MPKEWKNRWTKVSKFGKEMMGPGPELMWKPNVPSL